MERKKRSKGSVWEFCYANKIFGTYGFEIRALGQKLVNFCAHTNTHTTAAKLVVRIMAYANPASFSDVWSQLGSSKISLKETGATLQTALI